MISFNYRLNVHERKINQYYYYYYYDAGLTDDDLLGYADEVDNYSQAASSRESDNDSGKELCESGGKIQGACNTEHSKDVTHDSDKQVKESTLDNCPDSVRRQILQDKQ